MKIHTRTSINARRFIADRNKDFLFIIAYHPDSLNENQLLFEMARFNFTTFIVRNFDINITDNDGIHRMEISGFRNFDEAHQYAKEVFAQSNIVNRMRKARSILISSENLELLGKQYSYDDYDEFYIKNFAPLRVSTDNLLSEPVDMGEGKEPDLSSKRPADDAADDTDDGMMINETPEATENEDDSFDLPDDVDNNTNEPEEEDDAFTPDSPTVPNTPVSPPSRPLIQGDDGELSVPDDDDGQSIPDDEDDGGFSIPDDNGGQSTPNDDDDGLSIPDNDQSGTPSSSGGIDDLDIDIAIPAGGNGNAGNNDDDDNEYILQSKRRGNSNNNNGANAVSRQTLNGDSPLMEMRNQQQEILELPTASDTNTPATNKKKKEQPKQEVKPTKKEQPKPEVEDTGIDFDDEEFSIEAPPEPSSNKKKKKEPVEFDLDDEYYELDGF